MLFKSIYCGIPSRDTFFSFWEVHISPEIIKMFILDSFAVVLFGFHLRSFSQVRCGSEWCYGN